MLYISNPIIFFEFTHNAIISGKQFSCMIAYTSQIFEVGYRIFCWENELDKKVFLRITGGLIIIRNHLIHGLNGKLFIHIAYTVICQHSRLCSQVWIICIIWNKKFYRKFLYGMIIKQPESIRIDTPYSIILPNLFPAT